ncbi:phage minor head protein [Cedecea neteri]|uniref:Phage head morphogenesis protein n=2 Tax=Cedecea neteri TaxID=158822 RepID=A0A291DXQ2_9ENTR|nr:phage minor head protein [Cedecea neteri]ATF92406.1 phage head morphogenesis protein [Cedecea neteri]
MPGINAGFAMTLKPEAAIRYFEGKHLTPTFNWKDLEDEAHAVQFTVAGILKLDVLNDIHQGLTQAMANGTTLTQFHNDLEPLLQRKGWLGRGLVADEYGELAGKKLMPYRLDTIFRTNIQSAYAAGRYQQQMRTVTERPYWEYNAVMDNRTRPMHASLNGRVFAADDPIWQSIYPPNGYRCRCWIRALTRAQMKNHPIGLESSEGRLVTVQQPYGTDGETRPVTAYRDPKTGALLVPDAGFHLNPGRGYLAGLGQSLLEKGSTAAPELAAVAVRETLGNNRLVSAMNRDTEQWVNGLPGKPTGDFRRVGALSPRALEALRGHRSRPWPLPVITLTDAAVKHCRASAGTLWPRLVSALYRPEAVVAQGDKVTVVTRGTGARLAVTLAPFAEGLRLTGVAPYDPEILSDAALLDGALPDDGED